MLRPHMHDRSGCGVNATRNSLVDGIMGVPW